MKTYLELEGKLGPQSQSQPHTSTFLHDKISCHKKTLLPQKAEKKKRAKAPVKRRFKVRVIAEPMPTDPNLPMNPTLPPEPNPTVVNTTVTNQTLVANSEATAATSIPVTVYNLAQGKFEGIPYPTGKPEAAVIATAPQKREDTPLPNTMLACTNLFDARASWLISLLKHLQLLRWRRQRRRPHPD